MDTTRRNTTSGNPQVDRDMLMGTGPYEGVQAQVNYHPAVYAQIAVAATKAWKTLQGTGDLQGQLSKVTQGNNEPYADFVDRLIQTASRIFGDADSAMPLVKQLAYEQANKWCKEAIRPWKNKDLTTYLRVCKDINESTGNNAAFVAAIDRQTQTLANIVSQGFGGKSKPEPRKCFSCGQAGHLKATCPQKPASPHQAPGLCPRCQKGPHWLSECKSVRDKQGNILPPNTRMTKNVMRGPPRGPPQIYGVIQQVPRQWYPPTEKGTLPRSGGPQQEAQDWTSVPPPDWY